MRKTGFVIATVALAVASSLGGARADSGQLDMTFDSAKTDIRRALAHVSIRDTIAEKGCLPGGEDKRKVCNYILGKYMAIMLSSEKGSEDLVGLTMICTPQSDADSAKCLLAYSAGMIAATKGQDAESRGKIMKLLIDGMALGNETRLTTDERRYTLQKSMGIWFHVYTADSED